MSQPIVTERATDPELSGWPRPRYTWRQVESKRCPELPDKLPVPWINGPCVRDHGDWHSFRENALAEMQEGRLCLICGEPVKGPIYLPAQGHYRDHTTSGGGGHARCVLLAIKRCPHLAERNYADEDIVGWIYRGAGLGFGTEDNDCHGDNDPVDEFAEPFTLRELKEDVRA